MGSGAQDAMEQMARVILQAKLLLSQAYRSGTWKISLSGSSQALEEYMKRISLAKPCNACQSWP